MDSFAFACASTSSSVKKGELLWTNLLDNFWEGFEPSISSVMELSNREFSFRYFI